MPRFAIRRVRATPEAIGLIERLVEIHGPVAFVQLGECEDSAAATCLTRGELLPNDDDLKLGEIGGAPFYVNAHVYGVPGVLHVWSTLLPAPPGGLGLEGLDDVHFIIRSSEPAASARPA